MELLEKTLAEGRTNFVLIGEAGCGKSEIALNLAKVLHELTGKPVHLFDMDMTKPLFRSRDLLNSEELSGVTIHFEEQFFDAPTIVGGVRELLKDPDSLVVMDVGGDDIGARAIGGFMAAADRNSLYVMYVLNYYRPFCQDIDHIDQFLREILTVSHLGTEDIHFIDNPNIGISTTEKEVVEGAERMDELVSKYKPIEMVMVRKELEEAVQEKLQGTMLFPVQLYLTYDWLKPDMS